MINLIFTDGCRGTLGGSHARGRRTRGEKPYYGRGPARTNSPLPSRKLVRSQLNAWFGEAMEEENVFSTNNLMNNAATLVEQGLGLALGVEYSPSLYDPNRFCYKRLYPDLVSRSVIVWKSISQPEQPSPVFGTFY